MLHRVRMCLLRGFVFLAITSLTGSQFDEKTTKPSQEDDLTTNTFWNTRSDQSDQWKTGIFGTWSDWSGCSRSCGRGVSTQSRQCLRGSGYLRSRRQRHPSRVEGKTSRDKQCLGITRRYKLCQEKPCSTRVDMRSQQCATFNSKPHQGRLYQWESYSIDTEHCELYCQPVGHSFYASLARVVQDGTPCGSLWTDQEKICIEGQCKTIGCDSVIGSDKRLDRCGICGGNNSSCRRVTGYYQHFPPGTSGYVFVHRIPAGASRINVTESHRSKNFLALTDSSGRFIINGNYSISWSGVYKAAGTAFRYRRPPNPQHPTKGWELGSGLFDSPLSPGESIVADGPTNQPVDVMIIYQHQKPNVAYSYSLPVGHRSLSGRPVNLTASASENEKRHHHLGSRDFRRENKGSSEVNSPKNREESVKSSNRKRNKNKTTHAPASVTTVLSADSQSDSIVLNDVGTEDNKQTSELYRWKASGYGTCSQSCGGGLSSAIFECHSHQLGLSVLDVFCRQSPKPRSEVIICNTLPCPPSWAVGDWFSCSTTCGVGKQTRLVSCSIVSHSTVGITTVPETSCLKSGSKKPATERKCQLRPCFIWRIGSWKRCSADCGKGTRHRKVSCEANGILAKDRDCHETPKPAEEEVCQVTSCEEESTRPLWLASEWKECSKHCGSTDKRTRKVICLTGGRKSPQKNCDALPQPMDSEPCLSCDSGSWFAGPWGQCTPVCGSGSQTREVLCLGPSKDQGWLNSSDCDPSSRPTSKQKCLNEPCSDSSWFLTEWSECSKPCGTGGHQSRSAFCVSQMTLSPQPEESCQEIKGPVLRRSCNEKPCPTNPSYSSTTMNISSVQGDYQGHHAFDHSDSGCLDQWSNCRLVVQARLCRTQHYRDLCCRSCKTSKAKPGGLDLTIA